MFGISKRERAAYEKLVAALADEVDWLRAQLGMRAPATPGGASPVEGLEAGLEQMLRAANPDRQYYDEDEEMILEEVRLGALDVSDAEAALAQIGALNRTIDFQ